MTPLHFQLIGILAIAALAIAVAETLGSVLRHFEGVTTSGVPESKFALHTFEAFSSVLMSPIGALAILVFLATLAPVAVLLLPLIFYWALHTTTVRPEEHRARITRA